MRETVVVVVAASGGCCRSWLAKGRGRFRGFSFQSIGFLEDLDVLYYDPSSRVKLLSVLSALDGLLTPLCCARPARQYTSPSRDGTVSRTSSRLDVKAGLNE